jgi:hypothetical protein
VDASDAYETYAAEYLIAREALAVGQSVVTRRAASLPGGTEILEIGAVAASRLAAHSLKRVTGFGQWTRRQRFSSRSRHVSRTFSFNAAEYKPVTCSRERSEQ